MLPKEVSRLTNMHPVLVTGATGRVGRVVVDQLLRAGVPVRALTRRPAAAAALPSTVEIVPGDLRHAAGRVGGDHRAAGIRDLHGVRRRRIAAANFSPVGSRSPRRLSETLKE
jgi:nucleoside-diphosphate-sugar epimerase